MLRLRLFRFAAISAVTLGVVLVASPPAVAADARAKRAEREAAEAKKLYKKMHMEYGGSCGSGMERVGGYPPNHGTFSCRYLTRKGAVRHGKFFKWWPDGTVRVEGEFWQGKKHGIWNSYLPNGRRKRQDVYYDGKIQNSVRFDENNKKVEIKNSRQRRLDKKHGTKQTRTSDF